MISQEMLGDIGASLIVMIVLTSFLWYVIYRFIQSWSKAKIFFLVNALLLILYTAFLVNGRIFQSEFGGALVWDFYMMIIPFLHTFIIGIAGVFIRKSLR